MQKALFVEENQRPSFSALSGAAQLRTPSLQVHAVSLICSASCISTEAHMLHTVATRYRTAAAAAVSKGSSSILTNHVLALHAVVDILSDHRQSSR